LHDAVRVVVPEAIWIPAREFELPLSVDSDRALFDPLHWLTALLYFAPATHPVLRRLECEHVCPRVNGLAAELAKFTERVNNLVATEVAFEGISGVGLSGCVPRSSKHAQWMVLEACHGRRHSFGKLIHLELVVFDIVSVLNTLSLAIEKGFQGLHLLPDDMACESKRTRDPTTPFSLSSLPLSARLGPWPPSLRSLWRSAG
jgi:hypothetical protein